MFIISIKIKTNYMRNLSEYINESMSNNDDIKKEIIEFIKSNYRKCRIKISKTPNKDGKYEVSSSSHIAVSNFDLTSLTNDLFIWTYVEDFSCSHSNVTSLEGAPEKVGNFFMCKNCPSLTSLEGAPKIFNGTFNCSGCPSLTSLEGAPEDVIGFNCSNCLSLKSLKGAPKETYHFDCSGCPSLTSLNGAPARVTDTFTCDDRFTEEDVKKVSKGVQLIRYEK